MTLTVPRAGIEAGRSANLSAVPVPQDPRGEAMAKLGNSAVQAGQQIQAESDQIALQRINLDMARDLGLARQQADQINDPVAVDRFWAEKSAQIKDSYLKRVPNLNAALAERVGLVFDEMNNRHVLGVAQRAIDLNSSQRAATWIEQSGAIAAEAATAPAETVEHMLAVGENAINMRLQAGDITPEQAAAERQKFRTDVLTTRARAEIANDPDAWLANNDTFKELGAGYGDLIITAKTASASRADKAAKDAELAAKERQSTIAAALKEGREIYKAGGAWTDDALLDNDEVRASPEYAETMAARDLAREGKFMLRMTPAQLEAAIAEEAAKPKGRAYELERLKVLRDTYQTMKTAWNTDGIAAAKTAGLAVPDLPQFDPNAPDTFAAGLAKRFAFDMGQREAGYAPNAQVILSAEERASVSAIFAPEADAGPKVALMKSLLSAQAMASAPAEQVNGLLASLGGDDVALRGLRLLKDTGDAQLVEKALRGQQQVKLGVIGLPPEKSRQMIFAEATGGLFDDNPRLAAQYMTAATALYAADAAGVNPDGNDTAMSFDADTEAQDMYRAAIARVTGVATDKNGDPVIGGLQEVNGAQVILPVGVHRNEVQEALDNVTYQLRGMQFNEAAGTWVNPAMDAYTADDRYATAQPGDVRFTAGDLANAQADGAAPYAASKPLSDSYALDDQRSARVQAANKTGLDPYRAFRAASIDGGAAPALGANAAARLQDVQFRRVGESDVYELVRMVDGRAQAIPIQGDAAGRAYRFRLTDFLAGAQK